MSVPDLQRFCCRYVMSRCDLDPWLTLYIESLLYAVASLGLVSPVKATDSVTPIFPKKLTTFLVFTFRHHYFSLKNWRPFLLIAVIFLFTLGYVSPLEVVTPDLFYLSDLLCPLFCVNSATFFSFGCHRPGGCHPRQSAPPRHLVTPLVVRRVSRGQSLCESWVSKLRSIQ